MYQSDLDPHVYNMRFPVDGVLAIGWLSVEHPFSTGKIAPSLIAKLRELAVTRAINQTRGFFRCSICGVGQFPIQYGPPERILGSAEVWSPGNGTLYASPDLIVHYVEAHDYMPPDSFVEALEVLRVESWNPPKDYGSDLARDRLMRTSK